MTAATCSSASSRNTARISSSPVWWRFTPGKAFRVDHHAEPMRGGRGPQPQRCSSVGLRRVIALPGLRSQRARPTNVLGHVRCNQCVRLRGRRASRVPAHWSSAARRPLSPNQIECARPNVGRDDGLIAPGPALRDSAACCNLLQWSQRPRALERKGDQTAGRVAKPPRRTRLGGPPARHSRPDSAALLPFASCRSDVARTTGRTRSTAGRTTPRR